MSVKNKLKIFFEEKDLPHATFEVEHEGLRHYVESDVLQDVIVNHTPTHEQEKIYDIIVKIDFLNGDVNHFLKHLAEGYVKNNY